MIAKLYHMSLYDLGQLLYGWVFGRDYWVQRRKAGPTTTTWSNTALNDTVNWTVSAANWEVRRIRFRVPRDAYDKDY